MFNRIHLPRAATLLRWSVFASLCLLVSVVNGANARFLGDLDLDGKITVLDLVRLQLHLGGSAPLPADTSLLADVNQDGLVTEADVDAIADMILDETLEECPAPRILSSSPAPGEGNVLSITHISFGQEVAEMDVG